MNDPKLVRIGYWSGRKGQSELPWPGDLVDNDWDPAERNRVANYIESSAVHTMWRGLSRCRLCGYDRNGSTCRSDGIYLFPEGFANYVQDHNVRPSDDFIEHVQARTKDRTPVNRRECDEKSSD